MLKEQQVINFKQKDHLNIQKEENNSSINYKTGRLVSKGNSYALHLFMHNLFLFLGFRRAVATQRGLSRALSRGEDGEERSVQQIVPNTGQNQQEN